MVSDLNLYVLAEEILLDFEPGLTQTVAERLQKYIIADDVQVVDVALHYGLLSAQGPKAGEVLVALGISPVLPAKLHSVTVHQHDAGEVYVVNQPRLGSSGYDLFVPAAALQETAHRLATAAGEKGGLLCGWEAFELARIEAGLPRFGVDMDETNLPLEAGLESTAISYSKGCYIGQEVIARLRTYGQVAKALRGLRLADDLPALPKKGDKLFHEGKEVGFITSAADSPSLEAKVALGYVRREANAIGNSLTLVSSGDESRVRIVPLPFREKFT
jgi:folate-binding protein YgfZ